MHAENSWTLRDQSSQHAGKATEAEADGKPSGRIRRLLLDEAGLEKDAAARELSSGLNKVGFNPRRPTSKRQSFETWLDAMMKEVPPGEAHGDFI